MMMAHGVGENVQDDVAEPDVQCMSFSQCYCIPVFEETINSSLTSSNLMILNGRKLAMQHLL